MGKRPVTPIINTDIPFPVDRRKRYDWDKMEVGHSFFTEADPGGAINFQHKQGPARYMARTVVENRRKGWRVWRKS